MYDVEIIEMLNLIHNENHIIFEMCKGIMPGYEKITWNCYEDAHNDILKQLDKYGSCNDCVYKKDRELIKNILSNKDKKKSDD